MTTAAIKKAHSKPSLQAKKGVALSQTWVNAAGLLQDRRKETKKHLRDIRADWNKK